MEKLTEKGEEYNINCGDIMQDLIDNGNLKRDVIAGINHCAELNLMDLVEEIQLFIDGILWERKRIKQLGEKE